MPEMFILKLNFQRLANIGYDVVSILNADREANQIRTNSGFHQLLIRKLAMSVACRM